MGLHACVISHAATIHFSSLWEPVCSFQHLSAPSIVFWLTNQMQVFNIQGFCVLSNKMGWLKHWCWIIQKVLARKHTAQSIISVEILPYACSKRARLRTISTSSTQGTFHVCPRRPGMSYSTAPGIHTCHTHMPGNDSD